MIWICKNHTLHKKQRMVFRFLLICVITSLPLLTGNGKVDYPACELNGIKLYGKVKFVTSFPDIKIKFVESFPDIKVKIVDNFPNNCGEWQIVENFPDFTVQVVESFPDIKVKIVSNFPGKP